MAYAAFSVVFGEIPSAAKWNILGTNDSYFDTYIDKSGYVVQKVGNIDGAVASGATIIPFDDSIPQSGEGNQFMTQAITPTSATNILFIEAFLHLSNSVAGEMIAALFQDATAGSLCASSMYVDTATGRVTLALSHRMVAGTTSATTFKIRAGGDTAGTTTFNGASAARKLGGVYYSRLTVTETKV